MRGPYVVLVMLGFGEIVRLIIANWQDVTGGMVGLRGIAAPEGFGLVDFASRLGFYYLVLATVTLATLGLAMSVRSRLDRLLVAIHEEEVLAEFAGAPIMRCKVTGLAISAFVAGFGGLLIGPFLTVLSPGQFSVFASVDMIVMVVVGGAGTLAGPLLGAVFLTYVPEGRHVFGDMSISDNLDLGAYYRRNRVAIRQNRERVLALFPILRERLRSPAGRFSGGQQQMVAIGRGLMSRPRLLLLDEPSLGLAPTIVQQLGCVIADLNRDGTTILLVEQNARMALRLAHRAYVIANGVIAHSGTGAELLRGPSVQETYLRGSLAPHATH